MFKIEECAEGVDLVQKRGRRVRCSVSRKVRPTDQKVAVVSRVYDGCAIPSILAQGEHGNKFPDQRHFRFYLLNSWRIPLLTAFS